MLTHDLLRFRNLSGYARPMFLSPQESKVRQLAADLLETFRTGINVFRRETEDSAGVLAAKWTDLKLPRGLIKVISDASVFTGDNSEKLPQTRSALFLAASNLLKSNQPLQEETFRETVFQSAGIQMTDTPLYADLPDYEKIVSVPDWTPEQLIARYNCVLVQSLLIYASWLEITVEEPDPARMRRFFKQLRFLQLLATVSKTEWHNGEPRKMKIFLDGPAAILENGAKYGLRLASFFPALFQIGKWKLSSEIKPGLHPLKFSLDSTCGLQGQFNRFSAYIPEEIRMFEDLFRRTSSSWQIVDDIPFLRTDGQEFLFPDMSFTDGSRTVHLELFHKWHAGQLAGRLDFLRKNPDYPLIIGADRSLFPKREGGDSELRQDPLFGKKLFLFSGFPGVERVLKLLNSGSNDTLF